LYPGIHQAEHGGNGGRDKCHGTNGKDTYIDVPCGTVVYNAETGKYVCDVTYDGQEVLLLKGGRGGLGNFQFRSATNQAPRYAQPGEPMEEMTIIMELKLLADVGLVGFPNAGKSTLFNRLIGQFRAIVTDIHGTTTDIIVHNMQVDGIGNLTFFDSPGLLDFSDEVPFIEKIVKNSDLLLFLIDDTVGVSAKDQHILSLIMENNKKNQTFLIVNKLDVKRKVNEGDLAISDYYSLGLEKVI